jgi:hypothetical protein
MPQTTMTNATVASTVASTNGSSVMVKYKGGEKKITIGPDARIIATVPTNKSNLKAGAEIVTTATKAADGKLSSGRITVKTNGVALPL